MTPYCFVKLFCEEKFLLLSFRLFIFFFCKTRSLLESAYFWRALTFGQNLVGLKNYAYYRITLTFGSRLLSELYGIRAHSFYFTDNWIICKQIGNMYTRSYLPPTHLRSARMCDGHSIYFYFYLIYKFNVQGEIWHFMLKFCLHSNTIRGYIFAIMCWTVLI